MSDDDYTRPGRAAEIRQAKRYKRAIQKNGICFACKHRAIVDINFGRSHCRAGGEERQHPACEGDGKQPKFQFDDTVLEQFRDGP